MRPSLVALVAIVAAGLAGCSEDEARPEPSVFVQRPDSRLIRVQSVGLAGFGPINPHRASVDHVREAFGEESSESSDGSECLRRWDSLGLQIWFAAGEGEDPCGQGAYIDRLEVAGEAAAGAGWNTAEGIRPLQRVAAVERIYPEVGRIRPGTVALVTRPDEFPGPPVLQARIAQDRVQAMRFPLDPG